VVHPMRARKGQCLNRLRPPLERALCLRLFGANGRSGSLAWDHGPDEPQRQQYAEQGPDDECGNHGLWRFADWAHVWKESLAVTIAGLAPNDSICAFPIISWMKFDNACR
jgi:hypothetical protein